MNAASTGVHAATAAAAAAAQEQHGVVTTERSSSRSSTQASPVLALPQLLSLRLLSCHGMGAQLLAAARQLTSLTSLVVVAAPGGSSSSTADTTNFSNSSSSSQACRGGSMLQGMQRLSPSSKPGSSSGGSSSTGAPQLEQGALLDGTTTGGWLHGTLQQLPHLQHLVLEHLPSSCVNPLTGLTALRQLALRGCGLRDLPPGVAAALTRVTQLDLSSNLLLQPPMSLAVLPQLEVS
jgi:Leucine-rich repeat (LRR) protein